MHTIAFLQRYTLHALMLTIAVVFVVSSIVNLLASGISAPARAFLKARWPRLAHLIELSHSLGANFREAAPSLLGVITGRPWQVPAPDKAQAAVGTPAPLPATNPPEATEPSPIPGPTVAQLRALRAVMRPEAASLMFESFREALKDHPEALKVVDSIEGLSALVTAEEPPPAA